MIDRRRIRVGVEIAGQIKWFEGLRIRASGVKYSNPMQNEAIVSISGLDRNTRDYLLSETSPYNRIRDPKRIILEAGRVSTGLHRVYVGDVIFADPAPPPDVDIVLRAKTLNAEAGNIIARTGEPLEPLSAIAQRVADDLGVILEFQAQDKNIANYWFSGPAIRQVERLQQAGDVRAFIDDNVLIVKDFDRPAEGRIQILNINSGMIGAPRATVLGADVQWLITGESLVGGLLRLESEMNRALNGDYEIYQLQFDISTHEDSFFYTGICRRL